MSDSVRPHRRQPTRLPRPWDSPGKNTGLGCHFLLQCMKVKSESEVAQSCPTPSDPMYWSLSGSSIHGICQARVLEWVAIAFSVKLGAQSDISLLLVLQDMIMCPSDNKKKIPSVLAPTLLFAFTVNRHPQSQMYVRNTGRVC